MPSLTKSPSLKSLRKVASFVKDKVSAPAPPMPTTPLSENDIMDGFKVLEKMLRLDRPATIVIGCEGINDCNLYGNANTSNFVLFYVDDDEVVRAITNAKRDAESRGAYKLSSGWLTPHLLDNLQSPVASALMDARNLDTYSHTIFKSKRLIVKLADWRYLFLRELKAAMDKFQYSGLSPRSDKQKIEEFFCQSLEFSRAICCVRQHNLKVNKEFPVNHQEICDIWCTKYQTTLEYGPFQMNWVNHIHGIHFPGEQAPIFRPHFVAKLYKPDSDRANFLNDKGRVDF